MLVAQADVHRVQDSAEARNGEVELHVPVCVPAQRRHSVARLDPEPSQGARELLSTPTVISIMIAKKLAVGLSRNDLVLREERLRALQEGLQSELHRCRPKNHTCGLDGTPVDTSYVAGARSTARPAELPKVSQGPGAALNT